MYLYCKIVYIDTMQSALVSIPPPSSKAHCDAGIRAFFRIAELWSLSGEQARTLLGSPSRATFYKWKRGPVTSLSKDTMARISYVLGIYKSIQILFRNTHQADQWVNKPNSYFGGRSALEHMVGGEITDLAFVRRYVDSVRGGVV